MKKYAVAALLAGTFYGITGMFSQKLSAAGMSTMGMLAMRCGISAVLFFLLSLKDVRQLKIHRKDLLLFLCVGILGQGMFSLCYFTAINLMSMSTACILLYLSPAIVTVVAHLVFKDVITRRAGIAVAIVVIGCACVCGFNGSITPLGAVCGLGSALCFALINIWDRAILKRGYTGTCVNFYICVISSLFGVIMDLTVFRSGYVRPLAAVFASTSTLFWMLGFAVFTGFGAYLCFSYALSGWESGKVAIVGSVEPVVACVTGVLVFGDPFSVVNVIGIVLVLTGIILQNTGKKKLSSAA